MRKSHRNRRDKIARQPGPALAGAAFILAAAFALRLASPEYISVATAQRLTAALLGLVVVA
jgi:hypothetical protein